MNDPAYDQLLNHIVQVAKNHLVELLNGISIEERQTVMKQFCRSCSIFLNGEKDWTGKNYCYICSPDPKD